MAAMSASDRAILAEINTRLKKNYKTLTAYLTDNNRLKKTSAAYKSRKAELENQRGKKGREAFVTGAEWNATITEKYGWLVNIYNTVPEIATIIKNAYINGEPADVVSTKISNSRWSLGLQLGEYDYLKGTYQNDRSYLDTVAAKQRSIKSLASQSGYTLSDTQATSLAASALKGGWDELTTSQEINRTIATNARNSQIGATPSGMMPGVPTATTPTELQYGNEAAAVRATAMNYGITLTSSMVEGYVQAMNDGTLSKEQVAIQFRNQAKNLYPALAAQLDTGSLNDAVSSYRAMAAQTLGIDDSMVDFTKDKFKRLLTFTDPDTKQARLMNSTEWSTYLRGLPEWQTTKEAKTGYDNVIKNVESMFGKVR
jgi:hypothetical protein